MEIRLEEKKIYKINNCNHPHLKLTAFTDDGPESKNGQLQQERPTCIGSFANK
jgi:hypothetical protein